MATTPRARSPARQIPPIVYGTAEKTNPDIIYSALVHGARALDTACQPKNYHEHVVGHSLQRALASVPDGGLGLTRDDLFIQSKFTTPSGHTPQTMPYLPSDSPSTMVRKSINMTLAKLQVDKLDALLLHAPMPTTAETQAVWEAMENLVGTETTLLGICNVTLPQLRQLWPLIRIKPAIVQNRFWDTTAYDRDLRDFCAKHGVVYQAFWVLRANRRLLGSNFITWLATKMHMSPQNALFLAVLSLQPGASAGLSVLTGTTRAENISSLIQTVDDLGSLPPPLIEAFKAELEQAVLRE